MSAPGHHTFVQDVAAGRARRDDIDTYICRWHDNPTIGGELHEYLGLTWDEYRRWAQAPEAPLT
ncbi:hypothetical protein E1091_01480 [Micromonospora fluostatini]|uniref:Uncharacterized protein n=1 Tax=Micromonospora fluostatini TaxID=1629071 RepID=A0ABY2DLI7_9ACTN|nr:hypothetical protein E1091_01480 [Micromonospora fluostatini]